MPTTPSQPDRGLPVHSRAPHSGAPRSAQLPHWLDPADAFDLLHSQSPYAVWLDAGAGASTGVSYLAAAHPGSRFVTASARAGTVTCSRPMDPATAPVTSVGSIFDFLRSEAGNAGEGDRKSVV